MRARSEKRRILTASSVTDMLDRHPLPPPPRPAPHPNPPPHPTPPLPPPRAGWYNNIQIMNQYSGHVLDLAPRRMMNTIDTAARTTLFKSGTNCVEDIILLISRQVRVASGFVECMMTYGFAAERQRGYFHLSASLARPPETRIRVDRRVQRTS